MKQSFSSRESSSRGQALAIVGILLFCMPLIWSGLRRAEFDGRPVARRNSDVSSAADSDLILTWQGSRLEDPRIAGIRQKLLGEVASDGMLRGGSPYVAKVVSAGEALASLTSADMPIEKAVESLSGIWLGRGGLKVRATANGRRDLDWTAKRIQIELNTVPDRHVTVALRSLTAPVGGNSTTAIEIPEYDLEVFCARAGDLLATPDSLNDEVLKVRGYPTSSEPEGQRLVEEAFLAIGTPVGIRVHLTEAGRAEPAAAGQAIRHAAVEAGVAEEDLLLTGSLLVSAERAESLRATVWATGGKLVNGAFSPLVIAIILASLLGVLLGGYSVDLISSLTLGAFGAAAIAAGMNALGVAWTDGLLLIPALTFALTVATTLLEPATGVSLSDRVRKPMSASTMLCALCLVTLLIGSNMQRLSDRQFALAAAAACALAWTLSTICVPAVAGLLEARPIRRATHGLDFAEWIVNHHRVTAVVAATIAIATGTVLLQPSIQGWVASPHAELTQMSRQQIERSLGGTSDLRAEIRFDAERTQRLRFLERASIVRAAVEKVKACRGVTGAMSLAEAAPEVARPADDAKTRDRNAYITRSNHVAEQLQARNQAMGGDWILGSEDETQSTAETWVIKASVAELSAPDPEALMSELHHAIQDVLRFHAGVSHELSGDMVIAAAQSTTPSRRPGVIGVLAILSLIVGSIGAGALGRGLVVTAVATLPGLAILVVPGFRPQQFGTPAFLSIAIPLSLGVLSCVRLVNDLREWSAATSTRHEAIAFALTGSTSRSRQALVTLVAVFGGLSVLTPQLLPSAVRAGVWAGAWATIASLAVFPLLLSGRLGRLIVREADRNADLTDDQFVAAPIRLEPVIEAPHFDLETARRRVRNAG